MLRHFRLTDQNVDDGQEEVDGVTGLHRIGSSGNVVVSLQWRIVVTRQTRRAAGEIRPRAARPEGGHELPVLSQLRQQGT